MSTGKWLDPDIPKRGWRCEDVTDLGGADEDDPDPPRQICDMCEVQEIRYVHTMSHDDYPHELECGCICAGYMEEDVEGAQVREAWARSAAKKKAKLSHLKAWKHHSDGSMTLRPLIRKNKDDVEFVLSDWLIKIKAVADRNPGWAVWLSNIVTAKTVKLPLRYSGPSAAIVAAHNAIYGMEK